MGWDRWGASLDPAYLLFIEPVRTVWRVDMRVKRSGTFGKESKGHTDWMVWDVQERKSN